MEEVLTNYYFNLVRCLYEQGLMDKALESLLRMEYDDVLQNLSAKTLQVKIYYDTKSWQALDSLLDSMSIYMRRKKSTRLSQRELHQHRSVGATTYSLASRRSGSKAMVGK